MVAPRPADHNLKAAGSNPAHATNIFSNTQSAQPKQPAQAGVWRLSNTQPQVTANTVVGPGPAARNTWVPSGIISIMRGMLTACAAPPKLTPVWGISRSPPRENADDLGRIAAPRFGTWRHAAAHDPTGIWPRSGCVRSARTRKPAHCVSGCCLRSP